jgi:Na+-translocating ferredoxin:NAD+ oxidoreductase RnfA subunit
MTGRTKLTVIKTIHTAVWVFFNVVIFYLLYAVIADQIDKWVWICLGLILLECIVLIVFKRICPITLVARKYSASQKNNFDIFLPEWLARHNKLIYSIIVGIAILILLFRITT